jgi:hypothetical protein
LVNILEVSSLLSLLYCQPSFIISLSSNFLPAGELIQGNDRFLYRACFLASVFTAIGICSSSFTSNAVIAFIISLVACALFYYGFSAISLMPALSGGAIIILK